MNNLLLRLAGYSVKKCMIISAVMAFLYYQTMYNDGSKLETQIAAVQENINKEEAKAKEADSALQEVEKIRATVGALSDQFKTVSQALPSEVQMSDIIRTVDTVSRASGVSIKTKEPRPVENKEYYEEIPLKITMEGTYSEITLFLYYLASTERIMKVEDFSMATPGTGEKVPPGRLLFEGQVVSYRFLGTGSKPEQGGQR